MSRRHVEQGKQTIGLNLLGTKHVHFAKHFSSGSMSKFNKGNERNIGKHSLRGIVGPIGSHGLPV